MQTTILVPRGPEASAVRRAGTPARIVELPAGAASADALPDFAPQETVVVLGLCGALWRMKAGDVCVYGRVVDAANAFDLEAELVDALSRSLPRAMVVNACTTKRVVTSVTARTALAQRFNADVVDMEGTLLAAALAARGVPFGMVRVVSDDPSRDLPPIEDAIDDAGRIRPLALAIAFARAPRAAFGFTRDVRASLAVLTEVAGALSRVPV
jgi:phosphorylase superfamily protein